MFICSLVYFSIRIETKCLSCIKHSNAYHHNNNFFQVCASNGRISSHPPPFTTNGLYLPLNTRDLQPTSPNLGPDSRVTRRGSDRGRESSPRAKVTRRRNPSRMEAAVGSGLWWAGADRYANTVSVM